MTRHAVLSEKLYKLSLTLEKTTNGTYFLKKQQTKSICILSAMQFLFSCLRMETISEDNAHMIINTLENILHACYFDFASDLLNAETVAEINIQQKELLFVSSYTISLCIASLCNGEKNYRETVKRYIAVIQTVIRAFLLPGHSDWLSAKDANNTIRKYMKCD